jgi:hypothetical protein
MGLQITKGKTTAPRRVLLYGVQGVGKSNWGAQAPGAVFLPTEDGLDDIEASKLPLATSYAGFMESLGSLYTETHDFKTLVVDSLDWLEQLIWQEVCGTRRISSIEDVGYGKGYILAVDTWRKVLEGLAALRQERGMMIILLAHAKIETFKNPEGDDFDRYQPRLHKFAAAVLQEWVDEVLFATYQTYTKAQPTGFGQVKAKGVGSGARIMRTTERPSHQAKNRLGLPDELPFSWEAYAQYLSK